MPSGTFISTVLVPIVVNIVIFVVTLYTYITLPLFYFLHKPWNTLRIAKACGARLIKKSRLPSNVPKEIVDAEYREYERFAEVPYHPLMDCETIPEAFDLVFNKLYPLDAPFQGQREILEEEIQYDAAGQPIRIDGKVLRKYKLSDYKWVTYGEVQERVMSTGRGLKAIGMEAGNNVALFMETGINFFTCYLSIGNFEGVSVTLFNTLNDEALVYALNLTESSILITTFELLYRVSNFIDRCPHLKTVIYTEGPKARHCELHTQVKLLTLREVQQLGKQDPWRNLTWKAVKPENPCLIMFTSGTTGMPKGVVATQKQLKEAALALGQIVRDVIPEGPTHTYIAYLPQAHILELSIEFFLSLGGVKIGYASPFTLNESAPGLVQNQICDLQLLKPTIMTAVPLVLDRMLKEINLKLSERTPFSKSIFQFLMDYKATWLGKGYTTPLVTRLACRKVQQQFGGRLQYMVVGSAPLSANLQSTIKCALDVKLIQGYGTTETSGGVICMDLNDLTFGRVGAPMNNVHVRIIDWPEGGYSINDYPMPRGEMIVGGKMISQGYYRDDAETKKHFFDDDGLKWFVTGDIVELWPDGTFKVIDRKKDFVKLGNGEYISLGKVEAALKSNAYVDNICLVSNSFINCLIGLVVPNPRAIRELATKHFGLPKNITFEDICKNREIIDSVYIDLIRTGFQNKLKPIELPSLIHLVSDEWSPDNDLLTSAMKLKRKNILARHHAEIEAMFNSLQQMPERIRVKKIDT